MTSFALHLALVLACLALAVIVVVLGCAVYCALTAPLE